MGKFIYKNSKPEKIPQGMILTQITEDLFYLSEESSLLKGHPKHRPSFQEIMDFFKVKYLIKGARVFNGLGLSTQVPARVNYISDKKIEMIPHPWMIYKGDLGEYKDLSQKEFSVIECVNNYSHIMLGGYCYHRADTLFKVVSYLKDAEVSLDRIISFLKDSKEKAIFLYLVDCEGYDFPENIDQVDFLFLDCWRKNKVHPKGKEGRKTKEGKKYIKAFDKAFGPYY